MSCVDKRYNRAIVFSGGGTRYAMYCGMYAAMEELNLKPDLIVASCGGSIAATIINSFDTNAQRKAFIESDELYSFVQATELTKEKMLYRIGLYCQKMMLSKQKAQYIEDVFDKYLVDMPLDISGSLPSLSGEFGSQVPTVVVGAKVLFDKHLVGQARNNAKLYRKTIFTNTDTASTIDCSTIEIQSPNYQSSAMDSAVELTTGIPMITAMRISISDMFYVQPAYYNGNYYVGGVVDLIPMEIAQSMAKSVFAEHKKSFNKLEEALIRAVFGFSGNERMAQTDAMAADFRIDTSDAHKALQGHYMTKKINVRKLHVELTTPTSYDCFVEDMDIQWQYGYDKIVNSVKQMSQ